MSVQDEPHQETIDQLSALVLRGSLNQYAAKEVIECGAWTAAAELIRLTTPPPLDYDPVEAVLQSCYDD